MVYSTCTSILLLAAHAGCVAALSSSVRSAKRAPTETHRELHSTQSVYQPRENSSQSLHQASAPSRTQSRKDVAKLNFMKSWFGQQAAVARSPLMRREKEQHTYPPNTKKKKVHGEPNSTDNKTANETFTEWEEEEVKKELLSPGLEILVSIFVTGFIMCVYLTVRSWIYSPIPWFATGDRLQVMLHETKEKLEKLNIDFRDRLPELQAAAAEGDDALLATQEQQRATDAKHRAKNVEIHEAAAGVAAVPEKLEAAASRCQDAFKEAVNSSTERLEDLSKREGGEVYANLQQAIEERKCPDWKPPEWMAGDEEEELIDMPPLGNLVRGAFAPAQLDRMCNDCEWMVIFDLICLLCSSLAFAVDVEKPCKDKSPFDWLYGLVVATCFDLICRLVIIRWCYVARGELKASRMALEKENEVKTGNELLDTLDYLRRGSGAYFDAYFRFHEIVDSWLYVAVRLTSVFFLFWGGFGLYTSCHNILEDTLTCEQHLTMKWIHTYSFIWVFLFTWNLLNVFMWLFGNLIGNSAFSTPIIKIARILDNNTFKGFPICLSLVESFVLKNSASQLAMLQLEVKQDLADIEIQISRNQRFLSQRLNTRDRLAEAVARSGSEKEFMERSERRVQATLNEVKPFVGLLAANVKNTNANRARNAKPTDTGASSTQQSVKSNTQEAPREEDPNEMGDPNEIAAPDVESM